MDLHLEGRKVVVTGGASGIGKACVGLLRQEGAQPIVLDLEKYDAVNASDSYHPPSFVADITRFDALQDAASAIQAQHGVIDGVVHAAAIGSGKFGFPFDRLDPSDWHRVIEVNVLGTTNVAHAFVDALRTGDHGAMVLIASIAGQMGSQTDPPYSASKAANINFAQCLAKDLAGDGVRVNTICPGMVKTPLNRAVWEAWTRTQDSDVVASYEEWAGAKIQQMVPLKRWQTPEDIANMVVFLLSDRSGEVTGQTINVDGGFVMHC